MKKILLILFASVVILSGCNKNKFTLTGRIGSALANEYLLLREVKPGILEPVDSVVPDANGSFTFRGETPWPSFFMLSIGRDKYYTFLISPGEKINFEAVS